MKIPMQHLILNHLLKYLFNYQIQFNSHFITFNNIFKILIVFYFKFSYYLIIIYYPILVCLFVCLLKKKSLYPPLLLK